MTYSLNGTGFDHAEVEGDNLTGYGYEDVEVSILTPAAGGYNHEECGECLGSIDAEGDGHEGDCEQPEWKPEGIHLRFNGAGVIVDDEQRLVRVWISVSDPRGAFCMDLTRSKRGELRLSVPTPWDSMGHAGLEPLASPGFYAVGGDSNPSSAPGPREAQALADAAAKVKAAEGPGELSEALRGLNAAAAPFAS